MKKTTLEENKDGSFLYLNKILVNIQDDRILRFYLFSTNATTNIQI